MTVLISYTYIIIQCLLLMFLFVAARLGGEVEAAVVEAVVTPVVRSLLLSVLSQNVVTV